MNGPNQLISASGLLRTARVLVTASLIAIASTSLSLACQGGGGGGGSGSGGAGGGGGGGGAGHSAEGTSKTRLPGFTSALVRLMLAQGGPFTGINVADDFPDGDCTARASAEIRSIAEMGPGPDAGQGGVPELRQDFAPYQSAEEQARQLKNIEIMLTESPDGQEYLSHIRRLVGSGSSELQDVQTALSVVAVNRLAVQLQRRDNIAYERNGIGQALRSELGGGKPNVDRVLSLFERLNEANAALATQEGRVAETYAGARAGALRAEEIRRETRAELGGLTVSFLTNMASGGAGAYVGRRVAAGPAVKFMANFLTDNVVGGAMNYGEARFQQGPGQPGQISPGWKSALTNTGSSVVVKVAEHLIGGPLKNAVPNAGAAAAVQEIMDKVSDRQEGRDKSKHEGGETNQ